MIKQVAAALVLWAAVSTAQAHEVWAERDGAGPVRVYLGEPGEPLPEGGDPEFDKLKAPRLLSGTAAFARKAGYLEAAVPAGDVRLQDDAVFDPWGPAEKREAAVFYARAGRAEARSALPLELAPTTANGSSFVLTRDGKPVPGAKVTVITPDKWSKAFTTDAAGVVTPPLSEKGRYILAAQQQEEGSFDVPAGKVSVLYRTTTTTFVVQ